MDNNIDSSGQAVAGIEVLIPTTNFGTFSADDYLYLYTQFGASTFSGINWSSDSGPEEWAAFISANPVIPEPATMFLLGSGLIGLAGFARKKLFKK
jgi:hypothetical protein